MSSSPECRSCGIYIHSGPVICEDCISKLLATARTEAARRMRERCAEDDHEWSKIEATHECMKCGEQR